MSNNYIIADQHDRIAVVVDNVGKETHVTFQYKHHPLTIIDTGNGWRVEQDKLCVGLDYAQVADIVAAFFILQKGEGHTIAHGEILKAEKIGSFPTKEEE